MLRNATLGLIGLATLLPALPAQDLRLDWRRIGNSAVQHPLGDVATGPIERVWYTADGNISVRTRSGVTWYFDGERWRIDTGIPPAANERQRGNRTYRIDNDAFRSDDGGATWLNLTSYRGVSLLGGSLSDLAVSPQNPDDIVAANDFGIWRSLDAGATWAGVNQELPNLSILRIVTAPQGVTGLRAITDSLLLEWMPGQRSAWAPVGPPSADLLAAVERRGIFVYRGNADGSVQVTRDGVAVSVAQFGSPVTRFWVDSRDGSIALAIAGNRVMRTLNGGLSWDDITGSLPDGRLRGITADRATGALYLAGDQGVFYGTLDFQVLGSAPAWRKLDALPAIRTNDVFLDAAANQLYVSVEGYGVFATLAPHRRRLPALVNAADLSSRTAAPGALFSLLGAGVTSARSGDRVIPLLASSEGESQLQVPFEAQGSELALRFESGASRWDLKLPLDVAAPAIFVDRDGSPMLLDGNSGVLLDAMNPARSGARLQILATGLGRVNPEWPTGLEAPLEDPPAVLAPIRVLLDGQPLETTRATLAPGYVGFYLIEAQMPSLVNSGTAELRLEVAGRASNSVRVYIEP